MPGPEDARRVSARAPVPAAEPSGVARAELLRSECCCEDACRYLDMTEGRRDEADEPRPPQAGSRRARRS